MPRTARTVFAGIPHHITQRRNRRGDVFFDEEDRSAYLEQLSGYCDLDETYLWFCVCYVERNPVRTCLADRMHSSNGWSDKPVEPSGFDLSADPEKGSVPFFHVSTRNVKRGQARSPLEQNAGQMQALWIYPLLA